MQMFPIFSTLYLELLVQFLLNPVSHMNQSDLPLT